MSISIDLALCKYYIVIVIFFTTKFLSRYLPKETVGCPKSHVTSRWKLEVSRYHGISNGLAKPEGLASPPRRNQLQNVIFTPQMFTLGVFLFLTHKRERIRVSYSVWYLNISVSRAFYFQLKSTTHQRWITPRSFLFYSV